MPFTQPGRILIVDDQPANIQVAGLALGKLGHEIIPALDGPTALRRMEAHPPDLILLDVIMPGMDGCEVCRRTRAHSEWDDIPVIFLSAAADKDLTVRALESGGVDFITKPFNHAELISRVRTQLSLKFARDKLKSLLEERDELTGILAHDLKSHLGGMEMSAKLLADRLGGADPKVVQLAENIQRTSSQMLAFVKEFLANSAADNRFILKPAAENLKDVVQEAVRQYQETARRKLQVIKTEIAPGDYTVVADPSALRQVLDNLLSNALKFSARGACVTVRLTSGQGGVKCEVADEGPGFSSEDQAYMFRRYKRLSAKPTGGEPSTGLGLSIVRKLVEAMHGRIEYKTRPGTGTVFTIHLPKTNLPR